MNPRVSSFPILDKLRPGAIWVLILFPAAHILWIAADWQLRLRHPGPGFPRMGGIPDDVFTAFGYSTLGMFALAVLIQSPREWPLLGRVLFALVLAAGMFILMIFVYLYYVVETGIDSL